jgi:hypothetical protein
MFSMALAGFWDFESGENRVLRLSRPTENIFWNKEQKNSHFIKGITYKFILFCDCIIEEGRAGEQRFSANRK